MSSVIKGIVDAFREGGWPMYPILLLLLVSWAIVVERIIYLKNCSIDKKRLLSLLKSQIMSGNIQGALSICASNPSPVTRIISAGLIKFNRSEEEIQSAMDEAALAELPRVEANTGYLAMIANVATLVGLLGTILGLIHSFAGVAGVDPSLKATLLAKGISEAMNCTAFGLICAVPALILFAVLNGMTQRVLDNTNEVSVHVLNMVVSHRSAMKQGNA